MQAGDDGAAAAGRVATGPARAGEGFFDRLFGGCGRGRRASKNSSARTANSKPGAIWPSAWPNATRATKRCCACRQTRSAKAPTSKTPSPRSSCSIAADRSCARSSPMPARSRRPRRLHRGQRERPRRPRRLRRPALLARADARRLQFAHPGHGRSLARPRRAGRAGDAPPELSLYPYPAASAAHGLHRRRAKPARRRARHHVGRRRPLSARHSRRRRAPRAATASGASRSPPSQRPIDFVRIIPFVGIERRKTRR